MTNGLHNPASNTVILAAESRPGRPSVVEAEKMAGRRHQNPAPYKRGHWWCISPWEDAFREGKFVRVRVRHKLAPAEYPVRKVLKIRDEYMRPFNLGMIKIGGAILFADYVRAHYLRKEYKALAKSTQDRYIGVIRNYLIPTFGETPLCELTHGAAQEYFVGQLNAELSHESKDKVRDVLSAVMDSAMLNGFVNQNPMTKVRLPRNRKAARVKPYINHAQFIQLCNSMPEPYATMVYTAVLSGLRVSELIGLRWNDVHEDSITVDERCCRGDWGAPKSDASNATIAVPLALIERLHRMKGLTVSVRAGRAVRKYKLVKKDGPEDLVFQSVMDGVAMRDNNILTRYIKPAAKKLSLPFVNWLVLRRSYATLLKIAGADVKDAQAQMRHSRASTTLDIYQQHVPESQRRAVDRLLN